MDPIAIIGMSGRFPGASTVDEFWNNMRRGVESIASLTAADLADAGIPQSVFERPDYVKARGVLDGIDEFDAAFFGFSPRSAGALNPQHRIFLECAWTALESAGYDPDRYPGLIGVFAGCTVNGYVNRTVVDDGLSVLERVDRDLGNSTDVLSLRTAHKLNLKGPAITVQTTCSTSLVSVVLACRSLNSRDCDMALAGGVRILVPHRAGYLYARDGIASPDGHCRAFDAAAAGTVSGCGCAVVVLKRLADAVRDGDIVHAVIRGGAVNNDGADKIGFTAPSIAGQADVIARALKDGGVEPRRVSYVECHGTGTALGDPVEIAALSKVYGVSGRPKRSCAIGSVKTNIGHLDVAAGIAGLLKVILSLKHEQLPPSLHFISPNPECRLDSSPFFVNNELRPWKRGDEPRFAAVSSFGIGGTNAHVIVEEAPRDHSIEQEPGCQLLMLSAKSEAALDVMTDRLAACLQTMPVRDFANAAYTLRVGRKAFKYRRAVVASNPEQAATALQTRDATRTISKRVPTVPRRLVFTFPGEADSLGGIGRDIYRREPAFRAAMDVCVELFGQRVGVNLADTLYGDHGRYFHARGLEPVVAQAALFCIEYALAQQWLSWGVRPTALVAAGVGEYVAAAIAGVMSLPDSVALAALAYCANLDARGARASSVDDPSLNEAREPIGAFSSVPPRIPIFSASCKAKVTAAQATSREHWLHLHATPNQLSDAVDALGSLDDVLFLEVGPRTTIGPAASQELERAGGATVPSLATSSRPSADEEALYLAAGELWLAGQIIDWQEVRSHEHRRRVELPTYPFERQRFWIPQPPIRQGDHLGSPASPADKSDGLGADHADQLEQPRMAVGEASPVPPPITAASHDSRLASLDAGRAMPAQEGDVDLVAVGQTAGVTAIEIEAAVRLAWRTVLGVEDFGSRDDFFELGGDSLAILQTATPIRRAVGIDIPTNVFYEATTISELSSRIQSLLAATIPETDRIAALLERIESLTDDQASALLVSLGAVVSPGANPKKVDISNRAQPTG